MVSRRLVGVNWNYFRPVGRKFVVQHSREVFAEVSSKFIVHGILQIGFSYLHVSFDRCQLQIWFPLGNALACWKQSKGELWKQDCKGKGYEDLWESEDAWNLNYFKSRSNEVKSVLKNKPSPRFQIFQFYAKGATRNSGSKQLRDFRIKRMLDNFKSIFRSELPFAIHFKAICGPCDWGRTMIEAPSSPFVPTFSFSAKSLQGLHWRLSEDLRTEKPAEANCLMGPCCSL